MSETTLNDDQDLSGLPLVDNPVMPYLRQERIPHIWCPGCGIGTTVSTEYPSLPSRGGKGKGYACKLR